MWKRGINGLTQVTTNKTFTTDVSQTLLNQKEQPMIIPSTVVDKEETNSPKIIPVARAISASMQTVSDELKQTLQQANYVITQTKGGGDCFFDACAQSLTAAGIRDAEGKKYTVKSLRELSHAYVKDLVINEDNWVYRVMYEDEEREAVRVKKAQLVAVEGKHRDLTESERQAVREIARDKANQAYQRYQEQIIYSAEQTFPHDAMWGEQLIDGRIICQKLGVRLHVIEQQLIEIEEGKQEVTVTQQCLDGNGKNVATNEANIYQKANTIHIYNKKDSNHWEAVVSKATIAPATVPQSQPTTTPPKSEPTAEPIKPTVKMQAGVKHAKAQQTITINGIAVPAKFICHFNQNKIMLQPVIIPDRESYEKDSIIEWLEAHDISPKTHALLKNKIYIRNDERNNQIREFLTEHPELWEHVYISKRLVEKFKQALMNKASETIKTMLDKDPRLINMNLNLETEEKVTALHLACQSGSSDMLQAVINLLGEKFETVMAEYSKQTFLTLARMSIGSNGVALLTERLGWQQQDYMDYFAQCLKQNDLAMVEILLASKKITMQQHWIQIAVENKSLAQLKLLVEYGADIKSADHNNKTALHLVAAQALTKEIEPLIKYLIDQGLADDKSYKQIATGPMLEFINKTKSIKKLAPIVNLWFEQASINYIWLLLNHPAIWTELQTASSRQGVAEILHKNGFFKSIGNNGVMQAPSVEEQQDDDLAVPPGHSL